MNFVPAYIVGPARSKGKWPGLNNHGQIGPVWPSPNYFMKHLQAWLISLKIIKTNSKQKDQDLIIIWPDLRPDYTPYSNKTMNINI